MAKQVTIDGGEATAFVAYRTNEVCAIYPITPSSTMAELADQWASQNIENIWQQVPLVAEMQSEGGAAGTVHGALQTGALTTTFTASQGLMLMIPNMFKIAGELTPTVFHVAARALSTQGLSIFGDHQDVMAVRMTGFAQLVSSSVQECHDMALVSQAVTLNCRVPFIHFFDGFRTSHEVSKIDLLEDEQIKTMIDDEMVFAHRSRALNPDNPFMRGSAQNPDTYFQSRESASRYYNDAVEAVDVALDRFYQVTGRRYHSFEYYGDKDAERVIVIMGSGSETAITTAQHLNAQDHVTQKSRVGVLRVRLYRPFSCEHLLKALPQSVTSVAVLDRTKEPGSDGEPLYKDVSNALYQAVSRGDRKTMPVVIGGRYGLASKEFTPAMVARVYQELTTKAPKNDFTIGIIDDVCHSSLEVKESLDIESDKLVQAMFYGLGSDGTVSANKNSIKIIGGVEGYYAQGYFVYDSKKAGSQTVSHLRFGPEPIRAPYLIQSANFIACHQFSFIKHVEMLERAKQGATFLLNSHYDADQIWDQLPAHVQQELLDKQIKFYVIDGAKVARSVGMGKRINTVMQTCFFALSGVMPKEQAIERIKQAAEKTYAKKGEEVVKRNFAAIEQALAHLQRVNLPRKVSNTSGREADGLFDRASGFVKEVTAEMFHGRGDRIPVSMLPDDGTYPTGTSQYEKRSIASEIPIWDREICIQCGNCAIVCPHAAIRAKFYNKRRLQGAPTTFPSSNVTSRGFPDARYTLQVYADDCTGCGLCVKACPVNHTADEHHHAINMQNKEKHLQDERRNLEFFETIAYNRRTRVDFSNVRGVQFLQPLFEFSGACSGCGETPYLKLLSQLFGDRMLVANATGCSSIYGGNLPTTPWAKNSENKGPAWANSLFEDNAEFGYGYRLTADKHLELAQSRLLALKERLDPELVEQTVNAPQSHESEIHEQQERVKDLTEQLQTLDDPRAKELLSVIDHLVRRSIWIVGGDGWAYDIGYGGVDHVLASGRDVNILVMDTEVYSNTGGQSSKATPIGAVAKFAAGGKAVPKKDLALQAIAYGNVYVARIALGASPQQTLQAFREAEAYNGPSLIIAYSHCIEHGINMIDGMQQQNLAVKAGYWPLYRYNPTLRSAGRNPFMLDSLRPTLKLEDYAYNENRYLSLLKSDPDEAARLINLARQVVNQKWALYEEMATRNAHKFTPHTRSRT
ncbi:putative pyruvate oxidoreductase [Shewanella sediminis HAW-EB3]|uniref:Pyruvate-flavodoxin oxidoreductase n=1 Tax=Shewanella sediminis (strain HAW-EB3) TaxID=425104 RepID=A8FVK9_SHESH|nr:pyruvate:ferredoxin (flavodoxin) oxidoreductase [Shewanella sediminis]ABV36882.1 putative pyruvate oxidoreductase [Shewanella sediminis HAW-EB3]